MPCRPQDLLAESSLRYDLKAIPEGAELPFGVKTESGTVFVKDELDFETTPLYELLLTVTDGVFNSSTRLTVHVEDVNDNPPVFDQPAYEASLEEENTHVPIALFAVRARDTDAVSQAQPVVYQLEGQGVGRFFALDPLTREVRVLRPLDRDPPAGAPVWEFVVHATDEAGRGLSSYATVRVTLRDLNDNSPRFREPLRGAVDEGLEPGAFVMSVAAEDNDDPAGENAQLEYRLGVNKELDGQPLFRIDPASGKIYLMVSGLRANQ